MKKNVLLVLSIVFMLFLSACSPPPEPKEDPSSMASNISVATEIPDAFKGLTLYAWQGDIAWYMDGDGFIGLCDRSGNILREPYFDYAQPFFHGVAVVGRGQKFGYIDQNGQLLTELVWDRADAMLDGSAAFVYTQKKVGALSNYIYEYSIVNHSGQVVAEFGEKMSESFPFADGMGIYNTRYDGKWYYANAQGQSITGNWHDLQNFSEGLAGLRSGSQFGFIDKQGNTVIGFEWDMVLPFSEGLAAVKRGNLWGFIDQSGTVVIEPKWEKIASFSEGLAGVYELGYWGYINANGEMVVQPKWSSATPFSEGLAGVSLNGKYVYIDTHGQTVIEPVYLSKGQNQIFQLGRYSEGLAKVGARVYRPNYGTPDQKWGFIDKSGNFVIPLTMIYEPTDFNNNIANSTAGGATSSINSIGEIVAPQSPLIR